MANPNYYQPKTKFDKTIRSVGAVVFYVQIIAFIILFVKYYILN